MPELVPFRPLRELKREMDRLWTEFFGKETLPEVFEAEWVPALDVSETQDAVIVRADVPGIDPNELEITVSGNTLTIRGEKKQEREEKGENFYRIERSYGSFVRSIQLPADVDTDKVEATYKNGVLKIVLPKKAEAKGKQIPVKVEK
ncbi:heat shock protein Hsp20 [Thermodesulfatator indicus DSM 15286]|uniref:Heat shock protein Hsp20 n=1 Tax=Thermodesulfatator indicus (strain DSM 15286 / JCM 11887 / CIR29812) TaxID=667014 RepID=F8A8V8_THEID|nr:Hsp20/alpha crystallin family protein [Thermodesulfatator indicus]AEH44005.1 heat shock protein Hsp20 [Thermodesulfatator indicus DSM 15286]